MTLTGVPQLPEDLDGLEALYGDAPDGVRANMVSSADGAAAFDGHSRPLSDPHDLQLLLALRGYADVVLVGAGTVRAEAYGGVRLPEAVQRRREAQGHAAVPPIAVVTARGGLDPGHRLFTDTVVRPVVVTSERGSAAAAALHPVADVVVAGADVVEPAEMIRALADRGLRRVLCEGGPTLLGSLVDGDLVDDLCRTVSPTLGGVQPVGNAPRSTLTSPVPMTLRHVRERDGLLYLRYSRRRM